MWYDVGARDPLAEDTDIKGEPSNNGGFGLEAESPFKVVHWKKNMGSKPSPEIVDPAEVGIEANSFILCRCLRLKW